MSLLKKLFWISLLLFLGGCKKKVPEVDYPEEHYCEKFAGEYLMYDPINDLNYTMVISCLLNNEGWPDTITYTNLANRFDFRDEVTEHDPNICLPSHIAAMKDHSGNSTVFSMGCSFSPPPSCILRNDSLYIAFSINNQAFYIDDGVAWEICNDCLHYGVKVH